MCQNKNKLDAVKTLGDFRKYKESKLKNQSRGYNILMGLKHWEILEK